MAKCDKCGANEDEQENVEVEWFEDRWMCQKCIYEWKRDQRGSRSPRRGGLGTGGLGRR